MTDKNQPIDWKGIETDYRAGSMGIREIARWYQISDTAIRKRAKSHGWERQQQIDGSQPVRTQTIARTEPVIMAGVDATKPENIVCRGQNLIVRLLDELDTVTTHKGELEDMIESRESDDRQKAAMMKAVDLPSRANVVKALASAFKTFAESQVPEGKKAQRQATAEQAASTGRFSVPRGPKLAVDNNRT